MNIIMSDFIYSRDFMSVYNLFVKDDLNYLVINQPDHKDSVSFEKWFFDALVNKFNNFKVFYMENKFIGFSYAYNLNLIDGFAYVTVAVGEEFSKLGFGAYVGFEMSNYLLKYYPLRKLYFNVYDYNEKCKKALASLGARLEGTLKDNRYYDDKYHDLLIYCLDKNQLKIQYRKLKKEE